MATAFNCTLYTGVTSNLVARVVQHRQGTFAGFTERYHIHRLVYYEPAAPMAAAIAREKRLKRWRREKLNLIERDNPAWNDLAVVFGLPVHPGTSPG